MIVKNNDFLFLLTGVVLAGLAALALGSPDANVGLYSVAGLLGIVLVLAIIIKPNFGANVLIIAIFTNVSAQLTDYGYPGIVKPLVVIVFSAIMVRNYYAGQLPNDRKTTSVIEMFLIMYFIVVTASYLVASNKSRALNEILELGKNLVIIYTILFSLREWTTWKQAVWIIILTTAVLSLLGVYQIAAHNYSQEFFRFSTVEIQGVFDNDNSSTARIGGPVHDPNYWAQILVSVIPLVIFRIIHEPHAKTKFFNIGVAVILLFVLLNTYSRGAYLALLVVIFLTFFVLEKKINPFVTIVGIGLIIFVIPLLPQSYTARFQSLTALTPVSTNGGGVYQDGSLQGRSSVMLTALSMFADNPLLGVGAGNFKNNYQKYNQILGIEFEYGERDAHSLYTQVLSETGILGSITFLGILISLMSALSKSLKSIKDLPDYKIYGPWIRSLQLSIVGYLVASTFLHNDYLRYFWILVALSITVIQLVDEQFNYRERASSLYESPF
ncbi:MAG: O-antigen ligase family protein [bacterium]|nr:O-antigen ligase family protein [bacterium]